MKWQWHAFYVFAIIFAVLQVGHNREEMGKYVGRIQECGKITNSDNIVHSHLLVPLTSKEAFEMERHCMAMAEAKLNRQRTWFWLAPEEGSGWYNEVWHY